MALAELKVYDEFMYTAVTELVSQNIALFNESSGGTIMLRPSQHLGDFSDEVFYAKIPGLVRRRNVYAEGNITRRTMKHLVDTSVKVAAGTPEMEFQTSQWTWIQRNPEEAAAVVAKQLAGDKLQDILNTIIGASVAAMSQEPEVFTDVSIAVPTVDSRVTFQNLITAAGKFGDRQQAIKIWIMHSSPMTTLHLQAANNLERLFNYGTVNVYRDPMGRLFLVTDSPSLQHATGFYTLGLTDSALYAGLNNDWDTASREVTGNENIKRYWQAEWTYNIGMQGYAWAKDTGGHSPNDAAIMQGANWKRNATSHKDLSGVLLKSN